MEGMKWIKLSTNIFDDEKILLIENLPEHDAILVIWFKLLCLAGKHCIDGIFLMNDRIPYTDEMLAAIFRRPLNTIRLALATFEQYGMIEIVDDTITIPNWEKHQNVERMLRIRENNRERKARQRMLEKPSVNGVPQEVEKRKKVLSYTAEHPEANHSQIAKALGISRPTVIKYLACKDDVTRDMSKGDTEVDTGGKGVDTSLYTFDEEIDTYADTKIDTSFYTNDEPSDNKHAGKTCKVSVTRDSRVSHAPVTHPDVDVDGEEEHLSPSTAVRTAPSLEEVQEYFRSHGLSVDARRFFEVNEKRGWVTKTGKPVDDWKRLAETWNLHEKPGRASLPSGGSTPASRVPTPEEIMRRYGCSREQAVQMLEEDLY